VKVQYFQFETKDVQRLDEGVKIKGFASTPDLDRHFDIVLPSAFQKSLDEFAKEDSAPALLRSHNPDKIAGKILMDGEDAPIISEKGLFISALVTDELSAQQALAGEVKTLSIGFIPTHVDYEVRATGKRDVETGQELFIEARVIKELDLLEVSLVSTPANRKALFSVEKSIQNYFSSHPSPVMQHSCDYCQEADKKNAVGKIGEKFVCKGCIDKMQFKSEDVEKLEGGEATEDAKDESIEESSERKDEGESTEAETESSTESEETAESDDESSSTEDESEEDESKGSNEDEQKLIVSAEKKTQITKLKTLLTELDEKTVTKEEKQKVESEQDPIALVIPVLQKMAEEVVSLKKTISDLKETMKNTPVYKGKTMQSFQHKSAKDEADDKKQEVDKDKGFVSALKSAKSGHLVTMGDDE